jgi:hypothetical protein
MGPLDAVEAPARQPLGFSSGNEPFVIRFSTVVPQQLVHMALGMLSAKPDARQLELTRIGHLQITPASVGVVRHSYFEVTGLGNLINVTATSNPRLIGRK